MTPGVYSTWDECQQQTKGVRGAKFQKFTTHEAAAAFVAGGGVGSVAAAAPTVFERMAQAANAKKPASRGSAGKRSKQQEILAKDDAVALLASFDPLTSVICFTDGACSGNPGPAGAGAYLEFPSNTLTTARGATNNHVIELDGPEPGIVTASDWQSLGRGTNNIAELTAIGLAMDIIKKHEKEQKAKLPETMTIKVLTDSKYCVGIFTKGWNPTKNQDLITSVKRKLAKRQACNKVSVHWVAGHCGIAGNENADLLAVMGAEESARTGKASVTVKKKKKKATAQSMFANWQTKNKAE
jgi:ribonuclease HI